MDIQKTGLPGAYVLTPRRFGDDRGFFVETWNRNRMIEAGLEYDFVQDNCSLSTEAGTLRGLHYQAPPHAQSKLVSCQKGAILDAIVDARRGSPTYGHHFAVELSFENGKQLLVPKGFLHGFLTLTADTIVTYKVDDHYSADSDGSVLWSSCGINWGIDHPPILSEKDGAAMSFDQFDSPFEWTEA